MLLAKSTRLLPILLGLVRLLITLGARSVHLVIQVVPTKRPQFNFFTRRRRRRLEIPGEDTGKYSLFVLYNKYPV